MDVQFREDNYFIRKNNAAENMAAVRKMALNIIKVYKAQTSQKLQRMGSVGLLGGMKAQWQLFQTAGSITVHEIALKNRMIHLAI